MITGVVIDIEHHGSWDSELRAHIFGTYQSNNSDLLGEAKIVPR